MGPSETRASNKGEARKMSHFWIYASISQKR